VELEVVPLLHNISSIQRMLDFTRLTLSMGFGRIVVTRAYGAAAQHGLGEVGRLTYKAGASLIVLPDLSDAVDLLKPDSVLIVSREHARVEVDPAGGIGEVARGRVLVAFNGGDPDFSPQEASLGTPIYIKGLQSRIGPLGEAALILYALLRGERGSG
jgi:SpoU rRNA methylase family enzyme